MAAHDADRVGRPDFLVCMFTCGLCAGLNAFSPDSTSAVTNIQQVCRLRLRAEGSCLMDALVC